MAQINGLTVRFSDGIKTADYAPPRLYDITANVALIESDNVDLVILDTLRRISQAGYSALHGNFVTRGALVASEAKTVAEVVDGAVAETTTRKRRRTNAEIAADAALAKAAHPHGKDDPASIVDDEPPAPEDDPANVGDDAPLDAGGLPSGGTDDFSIEPEDTGEEPITDAALNAAVQRKNADLGDPEAIRAVIKLYNPDPTKAFQLREIPQDKRAEFITKLGGLTKASA